MVGLNNTGGKLSAHIHKEGWLSGSLYFKMPPKKLKMKEI